MDALAYLLRAEDLAAAGILIFDPARRVAFTCGAAGVWDSADGADRAAFMPTIIAAMRAGAVAS